MITQKKNKADKHGIRLMIAFIFMLHLNVYGTIGVPETFKIAFIADAHFHDIYASFRDSSFLGIKSDVTGKNATIRTMHAQLMSTRLFNENYFALHAALDDLAQKEIKYVGLVGDFSDDGQTVHLRRLSEILDTYTQMHGMHFFAIPGNHDPGRPVDRPAGKMDFLGNNGKEQKIFSKEFAGNSNTGDPGNGLPAVYTSEITPLGYDGIVNIMGQYGFYPQKDYIYWATPYSTYSYETYSYEKALNESALNTRTYEICQEGTGGKYKKPGYTNCLTVTDATYLVEPVQGIWLLAIDANVYAPTEKIDIQNPVNPQNFRGSGDAGYNMMISHKKQVIEWISEVVANAAKEGKTLITFSHFPMLDFYDGNTKTLAAIFGEDQLDIERMPTEMTMETMTKTGVRLNIAGHLHFNDTGIRRYGDDFLVNIQVPSLAAYVPGYKILTVENKDIIEVETVEMKNVPRFKELFEHYRLEYHYLVAQNDSSKMWDEKILESANYTEYTDWHLTELTRKRFLPQWPDTLQVMLKTMTGKDMLIYTRLDKDVPISNLVALKEGKPVSPSVLRAWNKAQKEAKRIVKRDHLRLDDFENWDGFDLAVDFYRMMNADELALNYIGSNRIKEYSLIDESLKNNSGNRSNERFRFYFSRLFECMCHFSNAEPSSRFVIDFSKKEVTDLEHNTNRMK